MLGCKTLNPKRSVGLQHPKTQKEYRIAPQSPKKNIALQHPKTLKRVLGCNTLSPNRNAGMQNLKPQKECWVPKPKALKGMLGCNTLSPKRNVGPLMAGTAAALVSKFTRPFLEGPNVDEGITSCAILCKHGTLICNDIAIRARGWQ